jgi:2-polyprenyl-3-methyl-5-hydroxy-6-metoxy-1,4-benzoquinol methylase
MKLKGLKLVDRAGYIAARVTGKKTLHLGCAGWPATKATLDNGTHLHQLIASQASMLYGVDLNADGVNLLKSAGIHNLVLGDVYELAELELPDDFDVIIAGELLEHLENTGLFLESVKSVMSSRCELVITTPNSYSIKAMTHSLLGNDHQDPTHVAVHSFTTLFQLLQRHGLAVVEMCTAPYRQLSVRSGVALTLLKPTYRLFPQIADDIVLSVRKVSS